MIKVGISDCLTGSKVRYDGGHRNNRFVKNKLSAFFQFVPLCPEVGIGLPIPRKTIRLIGDSENPQAVFSHDYGTDFTQPLKQFAEQHAKKLSQMSGYIFCKGSPSCGIERVKIYSDDANNKQTQGKGAGIFATHVQKLFPLMPVEDDGRLNDPLLCDSFIKRVYIYSEWKKLIEKKLTRNGFYQFHARHKLTLLAHCQKTYRELGPLVASINKNNHHEIAEIYIKKLMQGLKKVATRANNTNVLMHLQGYLKNKLERKDKAELRECILDYNKGILPILSPITLLRHHFNNNPNEYISRLSFFNPYPKELAIRVSAL